MHIKIGEVETLRTTDWNIAPDDRQTRIETIGGEVVQDFGVVDEGGIYSCKATLSAQAAATVKDYWRNREFVTVRDVSGLEIPNLRVVIKKYGYVERYEQEYFWAEFEFWRV